MTRRCRLRSVNKQLEEVNNAKKTYGDGGSCRALRLCTGLGKPPSSEGGLSGTPARRSRPGRLCCAYTRADGAGRLISHQGRGQGRQVGSSQRGNSESS